MPPRNKKKDAKKELSADDMRRLGMNEDDIARIIAERGKSTEDKMAEQERDEAQRREAQQRQRAQKELAKGIDDLVKEEVDPRVALLKEEDEAWTAMEEPLTVEKLRALRIFFEKEARRKTAEAKKRQEAAVEAQKVRLASMSEAERQHYIEEQQAEDTRRVKETREREVELEEKQKRREARRQARAERARKSGMTAEQAALMALVSSEDDEASGTAVGGKVKQKNKFQEKLDEMDFAMRERYES